MVLQVKKESMKIPKIIHYCWLGGGKKAPVVERCIAGWKQNLTDYKIIEWNESNLDLDAHPHLRVTYDAKQYAYASDYVRLMVLKRYGGIYLDADVVVKKRFDSLLDANFVIGFMYDCALGTAVMGSLPGFSLLDDLMKIYSERQGECFINNGAITNYFLDHVDGFQLTGCYQRLNNGVVIYPRKYFEFPTYSRRMGYSQHLAINSWKKDRSEQSVVKHWLRYVMRDVMYRWFVHYRHLRKNEFYKTYLAHKRALQGGKPR